MNEAVEISRPPGSRDLRRSLLRIWTGTTPLLDQGIISLSTFLFNILLARSIPLSDYGHYAMALGIILLMQTVSSSLIFYPLSIVASVADAGHRRDLVLSSLVLTAAVCLPMTLLLGALVGWLIDPALLLPSFALLAAGQLQEAVRRGLLSDLRHGTAILGDGIRYGGQVAALAAAAGMMPLSLPVALAIMAATALLGALVQSGQIGLRGARLVALAPLARAFWRLGRWSLTSNGLGIARTQCLPWLLGALSGPAAAGAYQIAMNIFNLTAPIVIGICNTVPQTAARALSGGTRAAWRASLPLIATGAPIVGLCCAAMLAFPRELVSLFYGHGVADEAIVGGIRVLAGSAAFAYAASVCCAFLHGVDGGRDGLIADLASTGVMLVLAVPMTTHYGLVGGCLALAAALAVRTACLVAAIGRRLAEPASAGSARPAEAPGTCR
ncbi:hypothetical protein ASG43_05195 [Aureimonas sp. Leaf454]|uniref:lipopolysaccharide biosynthesis protein n=1 Tax=Aureimonas sp. Leaf454 TaxID=1736381 RepID=UPI0006FD26B7|nr:oligosaccharide flippase family protein [Aureimonas sp. Leaf454]KQT50683.1 hypothetical protein ASG43_05195 [Aureimonas sp. Leaf454]